jgi:bile acid:Na+ symporter, BASS family
VDATLGAVYGVCVIVALWAAGVELGVREPIGEIVSRLRQVSLLARVAAVDVLVVPVLVWALVRALDVPDAYAVGLLLVGVASAGPLGVKAAQLAGADAATALSLVVVLELVNLAAIPVWAAILLPAGTAFELRPVLVTLALLIALPLAAGAVLRLRVPRVVTRAEGLLPRVANVALVAAIAAVVVRDGGAVYDALGERVPLVAATTVAVALWLGWLAGGPGRATRAAAALVTGIRANAVALAIAGASFAGVPEVRAGVVVFAMFSITMPLVAALVLGRRSVDQPART